MLKFLRSFLAFGWILLVAGFYYFNRAYFRESLQFYQEFIWLLLILISIYLIYFLVQLYRGQKTLQLKITPFKVFIFLFLFIFLTGSYFFIEKDISIYDGPIIFQDEQGWGALLKEDQPLPEGAEVFFEKGNLVGNTQTILDLFPETLHQYFKRASVAKSLFIFLKNISLIFGFISFFIILAYSLGGTAFDFLIKKFGRGQKDLNKLEEFIFSEGMGFLFLMVIVFILGALKILFPVVTWGVLVILLAVCYRKVWDFLKLVFKNRVLYESKFFSFTHLVFLALIFILSINFTFIIRPSPLGWDAINQYLNTPHLISESHSLISGLPAYNLELVTSLGFILFSKTEAALFIPFLGGILALFVLYILGRKFFPPNESFLLTTLFYSLPIVIFFAFDDKVDLFLVFIGSLSLLAFYHWWAGKRENNLYLWLCAIFAGAAFGVKYTAFLLILNLLILLAYHLFSWPGALSFFFGGWFLLIKRGLFSIWGKTLSPQIIDVLTWSSFFLFLVFIIFVFFKNRPLFFKQILKIILFGLIVMGTFLPWAIKNSLENQSINPNALLSGTPLAAIQREALEKENPACISTGWPEDVSRYFGKTGGLKKMFISPWYLTMNPYFSAVTSDPGFLFLSLIPALLLLTISFKPPPQFLWIGLFLITLSFGLMWLFTSSAIIWYGIIGFIGLFLVLIKLCQEAAKKSLFWESFLKIVLGFWLISIMCVRFGATTYLHVLAYGGGIINEKQFIEGVFPGALEIREIVGKEKPEKLPDIYRMGTLTRYFIEENNQRVLDDDPADIFNCLYLERDSDKTKERFREMGIRYFIYDKKAVLSELDPEGLLHQKYALFEEFSRNLKPLFENERMIFFELE